MKRKLFAVLGWLTLPLYLAATLVGCLFWAVGACLSLVHGLCVGLAALMYVRWPLTFVVRLGRFALLPYDELGWPDEFTRTTHGKECREHEVYVHLGAGFFWRESRWRVSNDAKLVAAPERRKD